MRRSKRVVIPNLSESAVRVHSVPDAIRTIMREEGISRTRLASALGVHRNALINWEYGKSTLSLPIIYEVLTSWAERLRQQKDISAS